MRKEGVLLSLIFLLVVGLFGVWPRYKVENSNKSVGLCLEMSVIKETSCSTNSSLSETLKELKKSGLSYIVLSEEILGDLLLQGNVQFVDNKKMKGDLASLQRIQESLNLRYEINPPIENNILNLEKTDIDFRILKTLPLGIPSRDALILKENGLMGIARHSNFYGSYAESIKKTLNRSKKLGINYYMPENDQLLGFKKNLDSLGNALKELEMFYVSPEFAKMQGDTSLGIKIPERTIRLHSAQTAELEKMNPPAIVERYVRAYKERNIRLLLLRPYTSSNNHPLSTLTSLLSDVKNKIVKTGGKVGLAKPFSTFSNPIFNTLIFLLPFFWYTRKVAFLLIGFILTVLLEYQPLYGMALIALLAPFYGYWFIKNYSFKNSVWKYGVWSLTSLTAGIFIAGSGDSLAHILHFIPFPGVKAVQIIPILGVGVGVLKDNFSLKKILDSPIQWRSALTFFVCIGILGFMLIRSGNDSPSTVSGLELKFRSFLDTLFYARPRTKEFLIGHPALWIGLSFMPFLKDSKNSLEKYISIGGIVLGTIGQVSIINTFCHFHTPLTVTFARVFIGLILGTLIGQIGVITLRYILKKYA